jgi:hypothetical protein
MEINQKDSANCEMDEIEDMLDPKTKASKAKEGKDGLAAKKIINKEHLFEELLKQNTYTDIVDFVLRFLK